MHRTELEGKGAGKPAGAAGPVPAVARRRAMIRPSAIGPFPCRMPAGLLPSGSANPEPARPGRLGCRLPCRSRTGGSRTAHLRLPLRSLPAHCQSKLRFRGVGVTSMAQWVDASGRHCQCSGRACATGRCRRPPPPSAATRRRPGEVNAGGLSECDTRHRRNEAPSRFQAR
jgi:hypothetical protein